MTDAPVKTQQMMVDEFIRLYDELGGIELIDGEIIKLGPTFFLHGYVIRVLFRALDDFVRQHQLGEVFSEMTFIISEQITSNWVEGSRQPDVMFVAHEKYDAFVNAASTNPKQPFVCIPDLVIEIISPNDRYSEVSRKITAYLSDGIRLIWVVDTELKVVMVYTQEKAPITLTISDTLNGGEVLPGFSISVAEIFKV